MKQRFLRLLVVLTILSLSLSAYALVEKTNDQDNGDKITICHKTGSANNPYVEITVSVNGAMHGHAKHAGDLIPAPEGGCPTTVTDN